MVHGASDLCGPPALCGSAEAVVAPPTRRRLEIAAANMSRRNLFSFSSRHGPTSRLESISDANAMRAPAWPDHLVAVVYLGKRAPAYCDADGSESLLTRPCWGATSCR